MHDALTIPARDARSEWVRLRTLILLRWLAVAGQSLAVAVAVLALGVSPRLDLVVSVIGALAAFNVIAMIVMPASTRLSDRAAMLWLLFDLGQLGLLLALTGGLANPFSVLMLAPVVIAATALTLRSAVIVGATALVVIAALARFFVPLTIGAGTVLTPPDLLITGMAAALMIAVVFLSGYARRVTAEMFSMSQALAATQLALGREQRLTALGGVVAAAAHELGTPLATIKLAAAELVDELADSPALQDDARLISAQADRCRDILRDMGRTGKDDAHLRTAPVSAVLDEAADPHRNRGKRVILRIDGVLVADGGSLAESSLAETRGQPEIDRSPEIIHGLRNLVQNAVDFASATVWIDIEWTDTILIVRVGDDGPGYPPELIGRIGDPYVRGRGAGSRPQPARPGYTGMGLGLFIAKTLLERSGARLTFANGQEPGRAPQAPVAPELARPTGAIIEVLWPRAALEIARSGARAALGRNPAMD